MGVNVGVKAVARSMRSERSLNFLANFVVSPLGVDLVQSSAKREDARLPSSGRANSRRMSRSGEPARSRTENQQIKSLLLCQLSYGPIEEWSRRR